MGVALSCIISELHVIGFCLTLIGLLTASPRNLSKEKSSWCCLSSYCMCCLHTRAYLLCTMCDASCVYMYVSLHVLHTVVMLWFQLFCLLVHVCTLMILRSSL